MDTYAQWMESYWLKSAKEKRQTTDRMKAGCLCPACISYTRRADNIHECLYCITGKSQLCIFDEKGCACENCPVRSEIGLQFCRYCLSGNEAAQRHDQEAA
jgi:hypothetical protein